MAPVSWRRASNLALAWIVRDLRPRPTLGASGRAAHRRLDRARETRFAATARYPASCRPRHEPPLQLVFLRSTITPKSPDFVFPSETSKPSAAKPRRNNSRTAAARLGM